MVNFTHQKIFDVKKIKASIIKINKNIYKECYIFDENRKNITTKNYTTCVNYFSQQSF